MLELSESLRKFLFSNNENIEMFSHRTISSEIADKIVHEGFKFYDSFQKTTDEIINDMVYLRYWDTLRKHYGTHIVVIAFSKEMISKIQKLIKPKFEAQQVLSTIISEGEDVNGDDMRFLLPKQYIKGHINRKTGEVTLNEEYDPNFAPNDLEQRIKDLNLT